MRTRPVPRLPKPWRTCADKVRHGSRARIGSRRSHWRDARFEEPDGVRVPLRGSLQHAPKPPRMNVRELDKAKSAKGLTR